MSLRVAPRSRPGPAIVPAGFAALLLLALAGCAPQPQLRADSGGEHAGTLFARGLDEIREVYLDPMPERTVALAGADELSRLDRRLVVADGAGTHAGDGLRLLYDGREVARYPVPPAAASRQWGDVLAEMIRTARRVSPRLAALPMDKIETAVLDGMTAPLDRFSRYSPPRLARQQRASRDGFGGIGVTTDDLLRITAVASQGPAARAGIRPGDEIVAIDGMASLGQPYGAMIGRLRGRVGSAVKLDVLRAGWLRPRQLSLRRAYVRLPTVSMTRQGDVAIFRITSFNRGTGARVARELAAAERSTAHPLAGVVLDLRGNPGGLLYQAVDLADLFIASGPIVSTVGRNPASRQYFAAAGDSIAPHLPVVVLINGGSASASEIVAAALQDHGRAVVVGSSSYGKGTVQSVLRLPNGGELIVTWARIVAPSGYFLQHHGVVPTLCTANLPQQAKDPAIAMQLAAAVSFARPRPRAALDNSGWAALRRSCPPRRTRPAIDLVLAERLLTHPQLYSEALRALPAPTRLAAGVGTAAADAARSEPGLTGADRALSSDRR